jgi:hypothetical protein
MQYILRGGMKSHSRGHRCWYVGTWEKRGPLLHSAGGTITEFHGVPKCFGSLKKVNASDNTILYEEWVYKLHRYNFKMPLNRSYANAIVIRSHSSDFHSHSHPAQSQPISIHLPSFSQSSSIASFLLASFLLPVLPEPPRTTMLGLANGTAS